MYVIEVTPFLRGVGPETLSYYSSIPYVVGAFLEVPIRNKNKLAMCTACTLVGHAKTALKAAAFSLKKLPAQPQATTVPIIIRETAEALTKRYPAATGAILFALMPPDIRDGSRTYFETKNVTMGEDSTPKILVARFDERHVAYQSHIRSTFARRGSVLLVVPTASDITTAVRRLGHGISDRVITLSGTQSKKTHLASLDSLRDLSFPKLIITTPHYAYIEREDIASIIVEQSASSHYVDRTRPYLDHRDVLKTLAKISDRSIILGDTVIRTEDEVLRRLDHYFTYGEEQRRMVFTAPLTVVQQNDKPSVEVPFALFSPLLLERARETLEGQGKIFLYSARRGLAPVVACIDCGYIFRCPDSRTPYSLMRTQKNGVEERWFVSSTSGRRVRAADVCDFCGSWRLRERGVGIQQVHDEWKALFPDTAVFIMDSNTANTQSKAKNIIRDFYNTKSAVLIATQVALPYLTQPGVSLSAIVSLDAARATPTWRADESLFRLLIKLRELSEKEVIVQTRNEPDALLAYAERGELEHFFDDEINLREQLNYPPFATFVLLSWTGTIIVNNETEGLIKNRLTDYKPSYYTNPNSGGEKILRHALIRIPRTDKAGLHELMNHLCTLPPYIKIEVNPERIV